MGSVDDQLDVQAIREALSEACPTVAVAALADATSGYTSRQWLADTDEGRLLVKIPMRIPDPEHMRRMIVATRLASEQGVPVIRYRGFLPHSAATGTAVVVQEFVEAERASDVWDGLDGESRLRVAEQFGALVAKVHQSCSSSFGAVLGGPRFATWPEYLANLLQRLLKTTPDDVIPAGREVLAAALETSIAVVGEPGPPALTHGDLWLENLLLKDGSVYRLLDFEHAQFLDPLYDFGKPDELVFERWPAGRSVFMAGYESVRALPDDAERRIGIYRGFQFLFMFTYFMKWSPQFLPEYRERLTRWAVEHPPEG